MIYYIIGLKFKSKEISLRISYDYQVGDNLLITSKGTNRKMNFPAKCLDPIVQVYPNSTAHV